jgi:hypothetical protein
MNGICSSFNASRGALLSPTASQINTLLLPKVLNL